MWLARHRHHVKKFENKREAIEWRDGIVREFVSELITDFDMDQRVIVRLRKMFGA